MKTVYIFTIWLCWTFISCGNPDDHRLDKNSEVYIKKTDSGYVFIRDGKGFRIKGAAAHPDFLKELKNAGGNTARIYDTTNLKTTLDEAEILGLAIAVDLPLPKFDRSPEFYEEKKLFDPIIQKVSKTVSQHKNHPALLYWNLGNEIYYPYAYETGNFYKNYNRLIDTIHFLDRNHPVTTSTIGANKSRILSIKAKSPNLDFISFNIFGELSSMSNRLKLIKPIWDGPILVSEWGVNGPWEAERTSWGAPIEETSSKKAEQIEERNEFLTELSESGSLIGSYIFYWGVKNENTSTWYNIFDREDLKSESYHTMRDLWNNDKIKYNGPKLEYILINGKGAKDNIVLVSDQPNVLNIKVPLKENYLYSWSIRKEFWTPELKVEELKTYNSDSEIIEFFSPKKEGPYRLYLKITNNSGFFASANIPFYVLNPGDEL